ncbi:MAG: FolB domain-containing protein [Nitrospirae bacterium]|nr:MAG: FolB domain-containing protein [Nitrospirota bacterium]
MPSLPIIVLRDIRFTESHGVREGERSHSQWIAVDLELTPLMDQTLVTDNLVDTIDYAQVASRVHSIGTHRTFHRLEALAREIRDTLLAEFAISSVSLFVRKLAPPIPTIHDCIGVRLIGTRDMACGSHASPHVPSLEPARFLIEQQHRFRQGRILDLAAGYGRHTLYLAQRGCSVVAIDRDPEALKTIAERARQQSLDAITVRQQDLEQHAVVNPEMFGKETFDGIIVFFYLYRPLFPALITALKPGGILLYETFLIDNHLRRHHPRRKEFCLDHNELLSLVGELRIVHYDEGEHVIQGDDQTAFTARLVAEKPVPSGDDTP